MTPTLSLAFVAGVLSFLSPCVLPLIPSYVTFITGMSLDELTAAEAERERARVEERVVGSGCHAFSPGVGCQRRLTTCRPISAP